MASRCRCERWGRISSAGATPPRSPAATPGIHRGRPTALSDRPRAAVPNRGAEPPHDHEEGTLREETAITPGRVGAALSGNAGVLQRFANGLQTGKIP